VLLDGCMLHPKLTAGVSGVAHAHSLQPEGVDLEEAAGCQLLKPGLILPLLHFAQFHESSSFISLDYSYCNTIDMTYSNHSSDDTQWRGN